MPTHTPASDALAASPALSKPPTAKLPPVPLQSKVAHIPFDPSQRSLQRREMSVGDMRAALSQFSSSAMPMRMVQDRRPSTDLLPNLTAMALRPSMEGHYASPVATVRGSYISATTSPYALARTITGSNNSTTNSAPKPKVVRRTKSSGSPLLCGMFSTGAELSNFSDLQPDVKACGAGAGAGGSGTSVKIAISVVQEEWKSGEGRQSGGSVKRKSRFSMIKSRMRSGSDAAKIGVAV